MQLILNGHELHTNATTYDALRQEKMPQATLLIVNGHSRYWSTPTRQNDEVQLLDKLENPSQETWRALYDARYGKEIMDKLQAARVAICGLGGLGSVIALSLGRLGVGELLLIDKDIVEPTNLARQQYSLRHLGMEKSQAMASILAESAPLTKVKHLTLCLDKHNVPEVLSGYDIICEALDRPDTKAMLIETVLSHFPNTPLVAASGMAGYGSISTITTKKVFGSLYMAGDGESEGEDGIGLMAPRVGLCANQQATMIMRLILGEVTP